MTLSQAFLVDNPSANASAKNGTDKHIKIIGRCFWSDGNLILFMVFVGLCRLFCGIPFVLTVGFLLLPPM